VFQALNADQMKSVTADAPKASMISQNANAGGRGGRGRHGGSGKDFLWSGWILPASDADRWLTAGSAAYHDVLEGDDVDTRLDFYRAQFRAAALENDQPLSQLKSSTTSAAWHTIAE